MQRIRDKWHLDKKILTAIILRTRGFYLEDCIFGLGGVIIMFYYAIMAARHTVQYTQRIYIHTRKYIH